MTLYLSVSAVFGRGLRSSRIDRDEQDARAAAGLRRRRHEPQGGTIRVGTNEQGQRLSSAEALTVLLLHVEQGWAPGSSPSHLLEELEEDERSEAQLRCTL